MRRFRIVDNLIISLKIRRNYYNDFKGIIKLLSFPILIKFDFDLINVNIYLNNFWYFTIKFKTAEFIFTNHDLYIMMLGASSYHI